MENRPSLPSNIAFGLGAAVPAACGTAVTVNPGFSPQAAGKIDRLLLAIDNQGGLRGLVSGERPVEAIAREVQEGLSDAGYPIRTPAELGLSGTEITALTAGRAPGSAQPDYSHVLLAPVQYGKAPTGLSLTLGDSDQRGQGSRHGEVLPIRCALLDGRSLREEATARSDRAVPKSEEGWRSKASGRDQRVAALAAEIRATCEPLLGELKGREQAVAPPAPGQPGPVSEPVAAEPPSVSTERTTTQTGKKQIRVYNPGGTVILEFGHDRR